jgi:hypothetical protein
MARWKLRPPRCPTAPMVVRSIDLAELCPRQFLPPLTQHLLSCSKKAIRVMCAAQHFVVDMGVLYQSRPRHIASGY